MLWQSWMATYNRIYLLRELYQQGRYHWVLFLDPGECRMHDHMQMHCMLGGLITDKLVQSISCYYSPLRERADW